MNVQNKLTGLNENLLRISILGIRGWRRRGKHRDEHGHLLWEARAQKGW